MARTTDGERCPGCNYPNARDALTCSMCGQILALERRPRPEPEPQAPPEPEPDAQPEAQPEPPDGASPFGRYRRRGAPPPPPAPTGPPPSWATHLPASVVHIAAGLPGAVVLNLICCGMLGWGMGAAPHELGHAIAGWLMGYPSVPLPVVTFHGARHPMAFLIAWGAVGLLAWRARPPRSLLLVLGAVTASLWVLALFEAHKLLFLWAGHGGEVLFSAGFFYMALRGGLQQPYERPAYATLAWSAWFNNVNMFRKLIGDPAFQYTYHVQSFLLSEGSNDYSRIATHLGISVPSAATLGLISSLAIPPLGVWLYWVGHRHELWKDAFALPGWLARRWPLR